MTRASLQLLHGRRCFVFTDSQGEPLPVLDTRRTWRPLVYRPPGSAGGSSLVRVAAMLSALALSGCAQPNQATMLLKAQGYTGIANRR